MSLMTGRYISELIRNQKTNPTFSSATRTLAELLNKHNYKTQSFTPSVLKLSRYGYLQGFKKSYTASTRAGQDLKSLVQFAQASFSSLKLSSRERHLTWFHTEEFKKPLKTERQRDKAYQKFDQGLQNLKELVKMRADRAPTAFILVSTLASPLTPSSLGPTSLHQGLAIIKIPNGTQQKINQPLSVTQIAPLLLDLAEIETYDPGRELMRFHQEAPTATILGDSMDPSSVYLEWLDPQNELKRSALIYQDWVLFEDQDQRKTLYSFPLQANASSVHLKERVQTTLMEQQRQRLQLNTRLSLPKVEFKPNTRAP